MSGDELLEEMSATRKAIAMCLQRILEIESKIDFFTYSREQHWKEEAARRRESTW
jgi:hypothetical protein